MKRLRFSLIIGMAVVSLFGCGGSDSSGSASNVISYQQDNSLPTVTDGFYCWTSNTAEGELFIAFEPWSSGVKGDGFIVSYNNIDYFLPEGDRLFLRSDRQYVLFFSRAFMTEKGIVQGSGEMVRINIDELSDYYDTLNLKPPVGGYYGLLIPPAISANFQNGTILVSPFHYQSPPIHYDDMEIEFSGFIRANVAPAYIYTMPEESEVQIPAGQYIAVSARGRIKDVANNRVLVSRPGYMEF